MDAQFGSVRVTFRDGCDSAYIVAVLSSSRGCNDFVAIVLAWWAAPLLRLFRGTSAKELVSFIDGPYTVCRVCGLIDRAGARGPRSMRATELVVLRCPSARIFAKIPGAGVQERELVLRPKSRDACRFCAWARTIRIHRPGTRPRAWAHQHARSHVDPSGFTSTRAYWETGLGLGVPTLLVSSRPFGRAEASRGPWRPGARLLPPLLLHPRRPSSPQRHH